MKLLLRPFLALCLALAVAATARAAAVLNVTSVSSTAPVAPGQTATFNLIVTNSGASSPADDFVAGGSLNASLVLTNSITQYQFTVTGVATTSAKIPGGGGSGTMTFTAVIPVSVTEGGNYTGVVTISTVSAAGSGAAAVAAVSSDSINSVQVSNGGSGYVSVPNVVFTGGGGAGAAATATISGGVVTGITMTTVGAGYTSAPAISFTLGGGGTGATATANFRGVTSIAVSSGGSGYQVAPVVNFAGGGGGTGAVATATVSGGVVTAVTVTTSGSGYTSAPTISFSANDATVGTNKATVSTTVISILGTPDLEITGVTYGASTSYSGGDVIPMSVSFKNRSRSPGATINNTPWVPSVPGNGTYFRIQIVLSSNAVYGDADDFRLTYYDRTTKLNADDSIQTFSWNQIIPGNFAGSYYVLAKIDALDGNPETIENDLTINGNNIWLDVNAPRFSIQPTNFPTNYLASTSGNGSGNGYSDNPSASGDGRYTVFASDASNMVAGDTNGTRDIFIFDNQTNTTRRLNVSRQGAQANGPSNRPSITADGRYVAFESTASNLILGDTNAFSDIFVVDTVTGSIALASVSSTGTQGNNSSFRPSISGTGRFISFESTANNLASSSVTAGISQIYLRDRDVSNSGIFDTVGNTSTILISQSTAGAAGSGTSLQSSVSSDGRYIAFASDATNLVAGDTNGVRDVFLRDRTAGSTIRVSVSSAGSQGSGASRTPSLSSDGRYTAFASEASDLVSGDTNGVSDIFVYDRVNATTVRVSVSSSGTEAIDPSTSGFQLGSINPSISSTGRYVAYASLANNLTPGDLAGQYSSTDANGALDVFVRDRDASGSGTFDTAGNVTTTMASLNKFGMQTLRVLGQQSTASSDIAPAISADGRWVTFPSDAENASGLSHTTTNLISQDSNNARDIFVYDRRINSLPGTSTAPAVTITGPGSASTILVNTAVPITASATAPLGVVASVQFFVNGTSLGSTAAFPYSSTWTPTAVGSYVLSAIVTDSFGNLGVSANVNVKVNAAPSVGITSPAPGSSFTLGAAQTVSAAAAATTPGATITSVQIFANNVTLGTVATPPYSVTWAPVAAGTYTLRAVATDSNGITGSATAQVTVTAPVVPPNITLSIPPSKLAVAVNGSINLTANAADADGTVVSVRFLANGVLISTATTAPFSATFKPTVAGTYSIVAQATDNSGNITDSTPVIVTVLGNIVPDAVYSGTYAGGLEVGRFSVINIGGKAAAFIGYSTANPAKAYFYQNLAMDVSGRFSAAPAIAGAINDTGVSGTIDSNRITFIGPILSASASAAISGYYTGNIANRSGSTLAAIVGPDGSITAYVSDGSFADAGSGSIDASGNFNLGMAGGTRLVGKADPITGFMSGTLVGGPGGTVMAALATGGSFSDGSLRNLSTRGQVGTGGNILIAGFVVGGTTKKQVLVRAIGPTLSSFGITGALSDAQIDLYQGTTRIATNDNWAGDPAIATAASAVGAFPLAANSLDAVVLARLDPGAYTAQVSGTGGKTGVALVELYDVDTVAAFSPQKVINVATRGVVGTGENILIAGFIVSGNSSKKLLIRGIGPTLGTQFGVTGALADPLLQIIRADRGVFTVVRENDNWETGNDSVLVANAASQVGAFPLASGSKDSVILITLPPGTYNATVRGLGGATGVGLVEVYEVP